MDYLPMFLAVAGRDCLVVGGGEVAARKVRLLLEANARVSVVAPRLGAGLAGLAATGALVHHPRPFRDDDVQARVLVISATGDRTINARVAEQARAAGVPVNVVDAPDLCTFIVPSIVDRSPLVAAVSSGGAAPVLARLARARIEAVLPAGLGTLARLAGEVRGRVAERLADPAARRRFWDGLLNGPAAALVAQGREAEARAALAAALERAASAAPAGSLHLIELPGNDPDLLTLRAVQRLQDADLVLSEPGLHPAVLAYARRDAERRRLEPLGAAPAPDTLRRQLRARLDAGERAVVAVRTGGDALWPVLLDLDAGAERLPGPP